MITLNPWWNWVIVVVLDLKPVNIFCLSFPVYHIYLKDQADTNLRAFWVCLFLFGWGGGGGVVVVVVAFKAACSHCSLRSGPCLHPSCTGLQGRATRSGCLAAIPCLIGVAAFVRKLPLAVHASHNLPARTQQHLLQSQYYVTTIGLSRAC